MITRGTLLRIVALILILILVWAPADAVSGDACRDALPEIIRGNVTLPAGCVFEKSIKITSSDTSLNCNGSIFDGKQKFKHGLLIDSQGKSLSHIKVENCTFRNFKASGIRITWFEVDTRKGSNRKEIYSRSPTDIMISNVMIRDNGGVGVFIDDYVTNVTVRDSVIEDSGGAGLYLEHSSRNSRILNNKFFRNGFGNESRSRNREAIAIDSSAENLIEGNLFQDNSAGGVFLYKNCGEYYSEGRNVIRWQHSEKNEIRNNRFNREKVGVWIASRQSRKLKFMNCGDKPMDSDGTYFEDFAHDNVVENNIFCANGEGIRIEGDDNRVIDNLFDRKTKVTVHIPVTKREQFLRRPPKGNVVSGGQVTDCSN